MRYEPLEAFFTCALYFLSRAAGACDLQRYCRGQLLPAALFALLPDHRVQPGARALLLPAILCDYRLSRPALAIHPGGLFDLLRQKRLCRAHVSLDTRRWDVRVDLPVRAGPFWSASGHVRGDCG